MFCAWVTYANNDVTFEACLILYKSLQHVGTSCDCVIMTPPDYQYTGDFPAACLSMKNLIIKPVFSHDQECPRDNPYLNKLHIWLLTEYQKVCWLDSDMLIMKNIDHLFDLHLEDGGILAAPGCLCNVFNNPLLPTTPHKCPFACPNSTYINAGLILTRPNPDVYQLLLQQYCGHPSIEHEVFSDFFIPKINLLPPTYNYMNQLHLAHSEIDSEDVHVFHFTYDKPWQKLGSPTHAKYYQYWRQLATQHKQQSYIHF